MNRVFRSHFKFMTTFLAGATAALAINGLLASTASYDAQSYEAYQELLQATPVLLDLLSGEPSA